ncbi:MAG: DMT family transporter [Actinomycetota bacterium]
MSRRNSTLLVVGVLAVSFSAVLVRLADDTPKLAIAFYRCAMAAVVLVPLAVVRHREELRALTGRQRRLALLSGAFLAAHFATWIPSLSFTSVAASSVLVTTQPLWVALFGRVIGERPSRRALVGIGVALAGTLVIAGGDLGASGRALLGDALAIAGAIFAAGYVLAGRNLRQEVSVVPYTAVVYATAAAILGVVLLVSGTPFAGYKPKVWLLFALITLGPQFLGHTVFNYLLGHLEAAVVAIAIMAEPVGATLLALVILGEAPTVSAIAGGALILAGVYLAIAGVGRRDAAVLEAPVD